MTCTLTSFLLLLTCILAVGLTQPAQADRLTLHTRRRAVTGTAKDKVAVLSRTVQWDPKKTAILICDMWDHHWCAGASRRVAEMAPVMNAVVKAARMRGVFIIHAPSDTMDYYKNAPQREAALHAPPMTPPSPMDSWCALNPAVEPPLPIDDSDGGCDDDPPCAQHKAWTRQHPDIEIAEQDAVTDSGPEVYNLLEQHGIENVIVMGVHTNMCVLGRSFGIRRLVGAGKHVALMRDMTDTMYNSRMRPHVSHFRGTDLMIRHVETYWCPTITSTDLLHRPAFHFAQDHGQ